MKVAKKIALVFVLAFVHWMCNAQEELAPTEKKQRTLVTEPITLYKGFFRSQLATSYSVVDKIFLDHKKQSIEGNGWASTLGNSLVAQYGITDRLEVEASINYVNERIYQSVRYEAPYDPSPMYNGMTKWVSRGSGLGDATVSVDYQFLKETPTRPAIALFTTITLPTGTKDVTDDNDGNPNSVNRPTGQGEIAVDLNLRLRKVRFPFAYGGYASYKLHNEVTKVTDLGMPAVKYKNGNATNVGGFFNLSLNDWISMRNLADYYYFGKERVDGVQSGGNAVSVQLTTGFSFQLKHLRLDQFVSIPIAGNLYGADPNYTLIASYVF